VSQYTRHLLFEMLQVYNDNFMRQDDLPRFFWMFRGPTSTEKTAPTSHK